MYIDISYHFKSLDKIIKTKANLGPQWITGMALG